MNPLNSVILAPFIGALLVLVIPRNFRPVIRGVAVLSTLASMLFAISMFSAFQPNMDGYQFETFAPWLPSMGINYSIGVDGINVGIILMGAIVAFAAACVSREIKKYEKEYYFLLLVMTGGILGAFASRD